MKDHPPPSLPEVDSRGVVVRVLQVGLCGTDREIIEGHYGAPPPGFGYLVLGHENLGVVEETGPGVTDLVPGDLVVAMVRRPGTSVYDLVGAPDLTTDDIYRERGINLLHGFLTERYVDREQFLIKVPWTIRDVGVLMEPTGVIEKGLIHAVELQKRLPVWRPQRAAVLGAGPIGLLASMLLRIRGLEVVTFALPEPPNLNATLAEAVGAHYVSARQQSFRQTSAELGPFDLIFEATGYAPLIFEAMEVLGKNGVLVVTGLSGGGREVTIPADTINTGFVLHNKAMVGTVNANREHFEAGIRDLASCETQYPGWLAQLLTHRIEGLDDYQRVNDLIVTASPEDRPIKAYVAVSPS